MLGYRQLQIHVGADRPRGRPSMTAEASQLAWWHLWMISSSSIQFQAACVTDANQRAAGSYDKTQPTPFALWKDALSQTTFYRADPAALSSSGRARRREREHVVIRAHVGLNAHKQTPRDKCRVYILCCLTKRKTKTTRVILSLSVLIRKLKKLIVTKNLIIGKLNFFFFKVWDSLD